jgi:hypothetical protein
MTKLKLGPLPDEMTVKLTVELPAQVHRDLVALRKSWRQKPVRRSIRQS